MYFKKLEAFGFKSFPEKTEFVFEPGITAIVGPNGCGKTNVADAVRWVLGEQGALALRGSRMEDVIFNGSAGRKPLGIAEVSLTLSNPENFLPLEYSEVTITRRILRSGEGQYFINRTPCRLRDINELFMDTGIGMEAYSFIEQGKVDLVLSSKPNDRRYLFEEAAGITKYKERKKVALRKLEATEQNLVRISDIAGEVKRQVNSLERQVRKAERYQETFARLKELEVQLALSQWERLEGEEKLSFQEAGRIKDEREELLARLSAGDSRLEESKVHLLDLERLLSERQGKSKELSNRINRAENEVLLLRERRVGLFREKSKSEGELEDLEGRLSRLEKEIEETEVKLGKLSGEREEREERVKAEEKSLHELSRKMEAEGKEIEESKATVVELISQEAEVRNNLAGLKVTLENLSARQEKLKVEENRREAEKGRIEERAKELAASLKKKNMLLKEVARKEETLNSQLSTLHSHLSTFRGKISAQRDELVSSSSRLDFLLDLKRTYEGYEPGAKAILQNQERFPGICGTVADLIDFPAQLELALEVALGENVQSIVIKTARIAEESITYLQQEKRGRATFLPLDSLRGHESFYGEAILAREGVIGLAFNLVRFDSLYREVFSCLLSRTVVVEDLGRAKEIVQFLKGQQSLDQSGDSSLEVDLVTLKGELIGRRGAHSGGSKVKGGGLLRRDGEIKELKEKTESLKRAISEMEWEEKGRIEELGKLSGELDLLREKQRQQEIEKAGCENDYSSVEEERIRKEREMALLRSELKEVEDSQNLAEKKEESLNEKLREWRERSQIAEEKTIRLQQSIEERGGEREKISRELTRWRVELASWEEKERSAGNNLNRLKGSHKEYFEAQRSRLAEIEEADRRRVEIDKEEEEKEKALKGLFEEREVLEGELAGDEGERQKILSAVNEIEKELKGRRVRWEELQDKIHQQDLRKAQLEMQMKGIKERLSSEYEVSIDELFREREVEEIDGEVARREIAELKDKIKAMGPVNLIAIKENKELEERYSFLVEQQEDLIQARESLQKVIIKINQTTRSLFMETLQQVQKHFHELFRTLFGGGKADLVLIDESDILESGIDIIAQPPGKKLQGISLLSGGERALTAIALLFALFKVKPSPFCFLDEIDAPLDESNIDRFSGLLREFTSLSQFIIITHNKRTIAIADVIYGVTMEESGVSKLVSVRFREREKERRELSVQGL